MQKENKYLITKTELQKLLKMKGFVGKVFASLFMSILKLNKLNNFYTDVYNDELDCLIDNALAKNNINLIVAQNDINNIPETGPIIILFNHPYGGFDALIAMKTVLSRRKDAKFMANFIISRIEPMKQYIFEVNPFEDFKSAYSSIAGIKKMYKHLEQGNAVCIFPAGEVSTKYKNKKVVEDRKWNIAIMKFIHKTKVPVVSAFISGQNSKMFHRLGKIHPILRTIQLPAELLKKKNCNIIIRYSPPLLPRFIDNIQNHDNLADFLKARTYCLDNTNNTKTFQPSNIQETKIIEATNNDLIINEIKQITNTDLLFSTESYHCFLSEYKNIPNIFHEISRLREITFREVGEGTGKEFDADNYDTYYKHLFIWDDKEQKIVGAYRMGFGEEIINEHEKEGFYINTLFNIKENFIPYLKKSIELGRSFIVPDYQRKPLPLFLLWKGIYNVIIKNNKYEYLIGPASISSDYSENAKILLIEYLSRNYMFPNKEQYIANKIPYNYTLNDNHKILLEHCGNDMINIDRLLKDIDINNCGVPVLIKKYIQLGGKILTFNVDPDFNFAIDALMLVEINNFSEEVINTYNR